MKTITLKIDYDVKRDLSLVFSDAQVEEMAKLFAEAQGQVKSPTQAEIVVRTVYPY